MKNILIRFDDICPTMNWEQWDRAEAVLRQYGVKPLLGVIPDCTDPELQIDPPRDDFWQWVQGRKAEGWAIAMHGVNHRYQTNGKSLISRGHHSEFAGLPYEKQVEMIRRGKEILAEHGLTTDIFFAPSHSYDENTLKALAANGFRYNSDGRSQKSYIWHGIKCLPSGSGSSLRSGGAEYQTAVLHAHEWVRSDKASGYDSLVRLCQGQMGEIVDFERFKQQPVGWLPMQRGMERGMVFYNRHLQPKLSYVKHILLHL